MFDHLLLAFIPIFVAVDPIGLLPLFVGLTHHLDPRRKRKIILHSMITALSLAIAFILLGKWVFEVLGISVGDFMIAGGVILLCLSINDLLAQKRRMQSYEDLGAVPLGTPLIVGPAVLTTSLIIIDQYGVPATLISVLLNILLVGLVFSCADFLIKIIGKTGANALSKIMALFLAAIAVMMIRKGIMKFLGG